ncbi:MAG: hypothetical protein WA421_17540 [Nitrososphaeraceae archaeon]
MAGKKIDEEKVEEEILYFLRVNERQRYAGFLLNQWASSNNHNVSMIDKAFLNSIGLLKGANANFLPLIFGASAIDYKLWFPRWSLKISTVASFDGSKLDIIERI